MNPKHPTRTPKTTYTPPERPRHAPPIPQKALPLSRKVDEGKPLPMGNGTTLARSQLYGKFASGLGTQGLKVFKGGTMSQAGAYTLSLLSST